VSSRDLPKIIVRLPQDVKDWLVEQAAENASSQTSEIVRAVRERMVRCYPGIRNLSPSPPNLAIERNDLASPLP
jgi:Arc-like DNA binding domain